MLKIDIQSAQKNLFNIIGSCIKDNEPIIITSKLGNVVLIREDTYRNIVESIFLLRIPNIKEDIENTIKTPTNKLKKVLILINTNSGV